MRLRRIYPMLKQLLLNYHDGQTKGTSSPSLSIEIMIVILLLCTDSGKTATMLAIASHVDIQTFMWPLLALYILIRLFLRGIGLLLTILIGSDQRREDGP